MHVDMQHMHAPVMYLHKIAYMHAHVDMQLMLMKLNVPVCTRKYMYSTCMYMLYNHYVCTGIHACTCMQMYLSYNHTKADAANPDPSTHVHMYLVSEESSSSALQVPHAKQSTRMQGSHLHRSYADF